VTGRPYRVIVTGSRDWRDEDLIRHQLTRLWLCQERPLVVVHGACPKGADWMASDWVANMLEAELGAVSEEPHRADDFGPWPACGPIRNRHMVSLGADCCRAFIGPCTKAACRKPRPHGSHGASGCADLAEAAGIPVRRFTP
jgi:hypothetical protein